MNVLDKRYWTAAPLFFLWCCQVERESPPVVEMAYFPLEIGKYWIYEVDETVYFGENDYENDHFYYRDEITDLFVNESGESVFIFSRQKSMNRTEWENKKVYTFRISNNRIIRKKDNLQEIILVFPLHLNMEWDANGANPNEPEAFTVDSEGPYAVNNRYFSNTIRVMQNNEDDLITVRDIRYDIYAEGTGLVESYYEVFSYCSRNDCLGKQIIQNGRFTHLKLVSDGNI